MYGTNRIRTGDHKIIMSKRVPIGLEFGFIFWYHLLPFLALKFKTRRPSSG